MRHSQRDLDEIFVVGKSALFPDDAEMNCNICGDVCARHHHERCLRKRDSASSCRAGPPSEGRPMWCLADFHVSDVEGDILRGLRGVDQLSRDLNAVRYDDCFTDGAVAAGARCEYDLAERFFPVTLGSGLRAHSPPPVTLTFSPPPTTGLPERTPPWKVATPHNTSQINPQWVSTKNHIQYNQLFLDNNPQLRRYSDTCLLQTPYQPELSRLRLERLRLEEEILMEVKRQKELERIRGPQPRWYELRDSRFHYEAKKNNELLRSCNSWQDLFDYRSQLKIKSEEFNKKFYPMNKTYDPTNYVSVS